MYLGSPCVRGLENPSLNIIIRLSVRLQSGEVGSYLGPADTNQAEQFHIVKLKQYEYLNLPLSTHYNVLAPGKRHSRAA